MCFFKQLAKAAAAASASGKSGKTVDYVKVKAANTQASEARELRVIRSVLQSLAEICTDNDEQSAIFRSTVDRFEPSVEGGALGFRGLRGLQ
jgi:hypothetical protein